METILWVVGIVVVVVVAVGIVLLGKEMSR